jgi:large subunit ribosomal protein L21
MFAIVETGGKQYRAAVGDVLEIEKLDQAEGDIVEFDRILMVSSEKGTRVGTPTVAGVVVKATLKAQTKGDKIIVFKMKRRKGYRRKQGHRQNYTQVTITAIEG